MWDWLARYPSVRIDQVGTPFEKGIDVENVASFDYVIVGGGTAGCVLANRLSANPSVKVLLLERGARHDGIGTGSVILTHAPFGIVPSKAIKLTPSAQLNQRQQDVYEALSLGGRTRINAGLYLQGCPAEYESWGEGWQWKDVEPFFKRQEGRLELEKYNDSRKTLDHEGGEWKTRVVDAEYESSRQYQAAMTRLGVPSLDAFVDPNSPTCFGIYQRRCLNATGRRSSTYHAFLPKTLVRHRKNLTICLGANVQQIQFSHDNDLRATGLLIEGANRKFYTVRSKHEIILCAGAIVTPQLLLLSGIGPKEHLSAVHKPCIHDLRGVGSTLQDHLYLPVTFLIPHTDSIHHVLSNPFLAIMHLIKFLIFGSGLFLSIISEYFCYLHSTKLPPREYKPTRDLPDLEMFWTAASIDPSFSNSPFPKGKGGGSIMIQNAVPKSSGTVRLNPEGATDIKVDPLVDPGHLSDPTDWPAYRRGLRFARKIGAEMRSSGYEVEEDRFPKNDEDAELDAYIREHGLSSQHLLSSCRMKKLEEGGVVDFELKVHGIKGLRIADGSVVPGMIASRPQATIVMIAERCAEFIRSGWRDEPLGGMRRY